jgi:hypothetical protein
MSETVYNLHTIFRKIKISIVKMNEACTDVPKLVRLRMEANSAEREDFFYV